MTSQTMWGELHSQILTFPDASLPGFTITLVRGEIDKSAVWSVKPDQHHILIHLSGGLRLHHAEFDNGLSTTLSPRAGDIWIIPAGSKLTTHIDGGIAHFCDILIPVDSSDCDRIILDAGFGLRDGLLLEAANSFERKLRATKLPVSASHLAAATFWHILDRYHHEEEQTNVSSPVLSLRLKEALVDFISENLTESITPEDLAEICEQTVHAFLRLFYTTFGTTPAQYIAQARIERAKSLLSLSRAAVDDIASRCGFTDPAYFSTSFIKHVGIAPLSYRQAHQ